MNAYNMNFLNNRLTDNTRLNTLIDFIIRVLFITNLWIILYTNLITFLNFIYPPVMKEQFYRPAAAWPEPFEMPLYLFLSFLFVFIIWVLQKLIRIKNSHILLKYFVFFFLLLVFLSKLSSFPFSNEFYPYHLRSDKSIYLLLLTFYLGLIGFIIIQSIIAEKIFKKKSLFTIIYYSFIALVIALFTFEPRFPISSHEYGYFFGPLWDVIQGKTLFTNIHTDYGFYATLFFSGLYKLGIFQFQQLPIYVWFMFIIQYFLSFYLIYKISRSLGLALIELFSVITVNYFSFFVLPITITQYSAMRRLPSVFLLFLLYKFKKIDARLLFLVALTDFWIVDVGVSMLLAVGLTLFLLTLAKNISVKRFLGLGFILIFFQAGIFIFINLLHLAFGYKPINLSDIFNSLRQHAGSGLTMLPIESHTYFWIVMLVYFASIIYFIRNIRKINSNNQDTRNKQYPNNDNQNSKLFDKLKSGDWDLFGKLGSWDLEFEKILLLFAANLSLFNALYFVGRSHAANLFDISILVILNCFLLIAAAWTDIKSARVKVAINFTLFFIFIVFPAYSRRYTLSEFVIEKYKRFTQGKIFIPETDDILAREFSNEKELIQRHLIDEEVLILAREETYLFILSNKKNLLDVNPQSGIDTAAEMDFAIKRASLSCPKKIAVDCRIFKKCPDYESFSQKSLFMAPHILDSLERKCKVKYQPTICTNKLCIAATDQ